MSYEAVEREIATWDSAKLRRLMLRIAQIRREQDPVRADELARLMDDKTRGNWLTLDEVDKRLAGLPPQE